MRGTAERRRGHLLVGQATIHQVSDDRAERLITASTISDVLGDPEDGVLPRVRAKVSEETVAEVHEHVNLGSALLLNVDGHPLAVRVRDLGAVQAVDGHLQGVAEARQRVLTGDVVEDLSLLAVPLLLLVLGLTRRRRVARLRLGVSGLGNVQPGSSIVVAAVSGVGRLRTAR